MILGCGHLGALSSERESEFPTATEWGYGAACPETWAWRQAHPLSISCTHSLLSLTNKNSIFFFYALLGLTRERDSWHQHQDLETRRPKGSTHRFRKSVVPENRGRRVVVLAAVDNHHDREGQGLQRHRGLSAHKPHFFPFSSFFSITTCSFFKLQWMSPGTQNVNSSGNNDFATLAKS